MVGIQILIIRLLFISLAALIPLSNSETEEVKRALLNFMGKLSGPSFPTRNLGWNTSSDPCQDQWPGVECDDSRTTVNGVFLSGFQFAGTLDAKSLCTIEALDFLDLSNNTISGPIPREIGRCTNLASLHLGDNLFSGSIPNEIGHCTNLTNLDLSNNRLTGPIPETLVRLTSLTFLELDHNQLSGPIPDAIANLTFRTGGSPLSFFQANDNRLAGPIPRLDFDVMTNFDVSNNDLSGPIPDRVATGGFPPDWFAGNLGLCGKPLPNSCPSPPVQSPATSGSPGRKGLGLVMIVFCCSLWVVSLVSVRLI